MNARHCGYCDTDTKLSKCPSCGAPTSLFPKSEVREKNRLGATRNNTDIDWRWVESKNVSVSCRQCGWRGTIGECKKDGNAHSWLAWGCSEGFADFKWTCPRCKEILNEYHSSTF